MRKMGFVVASPSQPPPRALSSDLCLKNKHSLGILPSLPDSSPQGSPITEVALSTDGFRGGLQNLPKVPVIIPITPLLCASSVGESLNLLCSAVKYGNLCGIPGHLGCWESPNSTILHQEILIIPQPSLMRHSKQLQAGTASGEG